jgi:glycosyltransferase involved in cell wall biosynthesis
MPKRILFITHLYYPAVGGAERAFRQLAEGLAERGWHVTVLTSDALSTEHFFTHFRSGLKKKEYLGGVEIIREPIGAPIYKFLKIFDLIAQKAGRAGVFFRPLTFGPHFYGEFIKLCQEHFPLIVAGPVPTTTPFYALLYKFFSPSSRVVILPCLHIKDRLHKTYLNILALRLADFVLPLTEAEGKYLLSRGLRANQVGRFFLAVEPHILVGESKVNPEEEYILYLGQEGEHKRIPLLLKAMMRLWNRGERVKLVMAGARTRYSWSIDRLIASLPDRWQTLVRRFNDITEEEKIALIDNCLVMVNPSSYESFGMVFLEAWARKKPVIGARIPAVREIIEEGVNGLLFDGENEEDLERKISFILKEKDLGKKMGERGYEKVMRFFTRSRLMDQFEAQVARLFK